MEPTSLADKKWSKDASGNLVMPTDQSDYLDWLLTDPKDREPSNEIDWGKARGIARDTIRKWKQDRRFKEQWERRAAEYSVSPERVQKIVDVLYDAAIGTGDVAAAKQYLLYSERLLPPKQIKRDQSVAHMSDAELRAEVLGILDAGFGA